MHEFLQVNCRKEKAMRAFSKIIQSLSAGLVLGTMITALSATAEEPSFYEGFREIRVAPGLATSGNLIDVLMPFLRDHPENLEGNPTLELKIWRHGAGLRVDLVKTGYLDDSVYGVHYRGSIIRTSKDEWELWTMAVRDLCARGEAPDGKCL